MTALAEGSSSVLLPAPGRRSGHPGGSGGSPGTSLTLPEAEALALRYGIPLEDVLLIAVNLYGISSEHQRHRARVTIRLSRAPAVPWMVIVPLNVIGSPFQLRGDELALGGTVIGHVARIDADEAVGGYFRNHGYAATLNPNARSRCTGCAFCPNTLEAAADPRLSEERGLGELFAAMAEQHPRCDLTELREVTVSTGCFEREHAALEHLAALRTALSARRIAARIGFLTSVVRTREAFETLRETVAPFVLRLTVECFSRRDLLLKASKADLRPDELAPVLKRAGEAGHGTSFTYIVGLDALDAVRDGVDQLVPYVTEFPNIQVYQAHNSIMGGLRAAGADRLEFYLEARTALERLLKPTGVRPQAWECYRPLWYFTFADEALSAG